MTKAVNEQTGELLDLEVDHEWNEIIKNCNHSYELTHCKETWCQWRICAFCTHAIIVPLRRSVALGHTR